MTIGPCWCVVCGTGMPLAELKIDTKTKSPKVGSLRVAARAGVSTPCVCRLLGLRKILASPGSISCRSLLGSTFGSRLTKRIFRVSPGTRARRVPPYGDTVLLPEGQLSPDAGRGQI